MPVRGGPTTNNGASIGSAAIAGVVCHACLEPQPRLHDAQDLGASGDPSEEMQLRFGVGGAEEPPVGLLPARPCELAEIVEPGGRPRGCEQLVGVEPDDATGVADRVAEEIEPADPFGVLERLHAPRTYSRPNLDRRESRLSGTSRPLASSDVAN